MIDGIFELAICKEMVPDLETANIELDNICDLILSSETTSILSKPELLQNECNAKEIFNTVIYFLKNPDLIEKQLNDCNKTLEGIKSKTSSSNESASILSKYLAF